MPIPGLGPKGGYKPRPNFSQWHGPYGGPSRHPIEGPSLPHSIFILHADWFHPASGSSGKRLQLPTSLRRVGQHPSSLSSPRLATSSCHTPDSSTRNFSPFWMWGANSLANLPSQCLTKAMYMTLGFYRKQIPTCIATKLSSALALLYIQEFVITEIRHTL